MQQLFYVLGAVVGYGCGSISAAILVCRALGLPDPRTQGSGNPGATNVMRVGGKKAALLTLLGDLLKGLVPVVALRWWMPELPLVWLLAGLFAFVGHLFPLFFGFRGGKGVATALGVLLGWHWLLALLVVAVWLGVFLWTRVSSLAALVAAFVAPWLAFVMIDNRLMPMMILLMVGMLVFRHRDNIRRLRSGEEAAFRRDKRDGE